MENPNELLKCFSPSTLEGLSLHRKFMEDYTFDAIRKFKLFAILIQNSQLPYLDLSVINSGRMSIFLNNNNGLKHISNVTLLRNFNNLSDLLFDENQIDNVPEIIQHLPNNSLCHLSFGREPHWKSKFDNIRSYCKHRDT